MPIKERKAKDHTQADWFAALGEQTRLALVRALATGQHTVTQLAAAVRTEMVNVSHHLKLLKQAGLVSSERDGRNVIYSLVGAKALGTVLELTHPSGAKVTLPLV